MKKYTCKLLVLLAIALTVNTANASNCITPAVSYRNFDSNLASSLIQQQHPNKDTSSYWVMGSGYYVTFTKDSASNQWAYKSSKPSAAVPNPDQSKKIAGATISAEGPKVEVTIGSLTYIFRMGRGMNSLMFLNIMPSNSAPATAPTDK